MIAVLKGLPKAVLATKKMIVDQHPRVGGSGAVPSALAALPHPP